MTIAKAPWLAAAAGLLIGGGAVALFTGGVGAQAGDKAAVETVVRDYILAHPEIIPEAMNRLQEKQSARLVAQHRAALEKPFAGAWAGSARPDATLVMFSDYSCGFCQASAGDIDRLLREEPGLRVVWRELPVLGPASDEAARVGLSAARQGRYLAFHRAMFASGSPSAEKIARVERETGVAPSGGPDVEREIEANLALARALQLSGTPAFVIGDKLLNGAVGYDALKAAVKEARAAKG